MLKKLVCSEEKIKNLYPVDVWDILRGDSRDEYIILDVRTPPEYEEGHIPGSRFIPLNELDQRYSELERLKKIIVYCRSGKRSMGGAILLCNLGLQNIHNMIGGVSNWPYELVKGPPDEAREFFKDVNDIKELFLFALQMEKSSQEFYLKVMQKIEDMETKDLMEKLSKMESKHLEMIYTQLKEVWPDAPSVQDIKESEFMEGGISLPYSLLKFDEESITSRMEALELALEMECKAFDLYHTMATKVEPSLITFFQSLALQERIHIDQLSRIL
ncbi:MAG: rhodanese-like domain-containing protein [Spirochaetota bacterium]|nr:rhodanese-like domain-containing protein [Spirochaetota bacterium]